jgi:hypothetical protein
LQVDHANILKKVDTVFAGLEAMLVQDLILSGNLNLELIEFTLNFEEFLIAVVELLYQLLQLPEMELTL